MISEEKEELRREIKLERNFFLWLKDALLLEFTIFLQHKSKRHLTAICGFKRQFCQQLPRSLLPPYSSLCGTEGQSLL